MSNKLSNYPKKKNINFIVDNTEKYNKISIFCFVIFMIFLVFFTKFAVIDTLSAVNKLESNYNSVLSQIEAYNAKMSDYDEVETRYNDLVGDFLTYDEQLSTSRSQIINMIDGDIGFEHVENYTIDGQTIIVYTTAMSIKDVTSILNVLQADSNVSFATCKSTIYDKNDESLVHGEFEIIYNTIGGNK